MNTLYHYKSVFWSYLITFKEIIITQNFITVLCNNRNQMCRLNKKKYVCFVKYKNDLFAEDKYEINAILKVRKQKKKHVETYTAGTFYKLH